MDGKATWIPMGCKMDKYLRSISKDFVSSPFQMGGTNTKPGDHDMSLSHIP